MTVDRERLESIVEAKLAALEERIRAEVQQEAERRMEDMARAFALAQAVDEAVERVERLVEEGRLTPAQAPMARALLIATLGVEGEARAYAAEELGELGGKTLHQLAVELLEGLPARFEARKPEVTSPRPNPVRAYLSGDVTAAKDIYERMKALAKEKGISMYEAYMTLLREGNK